MYKTIIKNLNHPTVFHILKMNLLRQDCLYFKTLHIYSSIFHNNSILFYQPTTHRVGCSSQNSNVNNPGGNNSKKNFRKDSMRLNRKF